MRLHLIIAALLAATPVLGESLTTKDARKLLFSLKGHQVLVSGTLSKQDQTIVKGIIPLMAKQLRQPVRYYAAVAYSPDDGVVHDSLQAALNFHTVEAASAAAIAACNKLKSNGAASCATAAQIVPKKYKKRALTLSVDATAAFDRVYRKEKSPKFFAISASTGGWGMGKTADSALKTCESSGSPRDCEIVIKD